jgi:tetratricopeptide (TPR) repeat protein
VTLEPVSAEWQSQRELRRTKEEGDVPLLCAREAGGVAATVTRRARRVRLRGERTGHGSGPHEHAPLRGHAAAGERHRAVHYFEMAGDHAESAFANEEAVASYREALSILAEDPSGADSNSKASVELRAKLAEVLWYTGRHGESRETFDEALRLVKPEDALLVARLQLRLGQMEITAHSYDAAIAAFDAAEALLGDDPGSQEPEWVDLWLELQLKGRAQLHYWRNEPARGRTILEAARARSSRPGEAWPRRKLSTTRSCCSKAARPATGSTTRSLPTHERRWQRRRKFVGRTTSLGPYS